MRWCWWLVLWMLVAFTLAPLVGAMLRRASENLEISGGNAPGEGKDK